MITLATLNKPWNAEHIAIRIAQSIIGYKFTYVDLDEDPILYKLEIPESFDELHKMTENEVLGEEEEKFFQNWENTVQASRQLGKFYYEWNQLIQPGNQQIIDRKPEAQRGFMNTPGPIMGDDHVNKAKTLLVYAEPPVVSAASWEEVEKGFESIQEIEAVPIPMSLGEKFELTIAQAISFYAGDQQTKNLITALAQRHGILPDINSVRSLLK